MCFICSHYLSHFSYYCCFNIVTFVILCQCLSCICLYLICIFVADHNGKKCLHFFVSSLYLMYFVFISYVYMYNVLHSILNKSTHPDPMKVCHYIAQVHDPIHIQSMVLYSVVLIPYDCSKCFIFYSQENVVKEMQY